MPGKRTEFSYNCAGCGTWVAALKPSQASGPVRLCARCGPSEADILPLILHGFATTLAHSCKSRRHIPKLRAVPDRDPAPDRADQRSGQEIAAGEEPALKRSSG